MQLKHKLSLFLCMMMLFSLFSYSAFAGTLASGTSLQVTSNNNEISGKYNLVGTWSTTPTAADSIIITNSQLPDPYGLKQQLVIDVPQPTFEQVFSVQSQKPIYEYALFKSSHFWFGGYEQKGMTEFRESHPNAVIVDTYTLSPAFTDGYFYVVYISSQKGWVGSVVNSGIDYDQNIVIQGVGTINLASNKATSQLSGSIPGVAIARLLGFSSWTNALLSDKNVYAYHAGSSTSVGKWQPFSDNNQYYIAYISAETNMKNALPETGSISLSSFESTLNGAIQSVNKQSSYIVGAASNYPAQWSAVSNQAGVTSTSNNINVPLKMPVLTANIQLILNGDKIGLFVATGVPVIYSIDKSVTFSETQSANINYIAQNSGQSDGSFQTSLVCPSGKITGRADQFTISAGEKANKQMYVTAKTNSNEDLSDKCTFTLTESTTGQKVTQQITVNVQAKANCAAGQQSDPYQSGTLTVVDIYDSSCKVVDQVKCTTASQDTKLVNGKYECVAKEGVAGKGATNFSMPLLISSLVVGLIFAIVAYVNLKAFSFGKYTKIALTVITIMAFVFGIMATVYVVNAFITYFSI